MVPSPLHLDASLEQQAAALTASMLGGAGADDKDLVKAQNKVGMVFGRQSLKPLKYSHQIHVMSIYFGELKYKFQQFP